MVDLDQNKNNIFFVNRSEITDRLDPLMAQYNKGLRSFNYDLVSLKSLLLQAPQYGANESGVERKKAEEVRYIRITDIDENGLLKQDSLGATAINIEDRFILQKDDILFARSGNTVGKAYIHKGVEKSIFAGYMIRYVVDRRKVLPDFIFTYTQLKPYKDWVRSVQRAAGQPNINAEEYKSLQIPLPPFDVQTVIVDKINNAYNHKQQKDAEAKSLLDGIDDYILGELGVIAPQQSRNLKDRVFFTSMQSISEGRFDAPSYFDQVNLSSLKYENKKLSELVRINPNTTFSTLNQDEEISFVPMEAVDEIYGQLKYIRQIPVTQTKGFTKFSEGDLIWAKITPCMQNGKSTVVRDLSNGVGCGSTEFFVMRPRNTGVLIDYVYNLLRLKCVLKSAQNSFGGSAGQQRVSSSFLNNMVLPAPSYEIQQKIVKEVGLRKFKAKQLQQEGAAILSAAKAEVERMILG